LHSRSSPPAPTGPVVAQIKRPRISAFCTRPRQCRPLQLSGCNRARSERTYYIRAYMGRVGEEGRARITCRWQGCRRPIIRWFGSKGPVTRAVDRPPGVLYCWSLGRACDVREGTPLIYGDILFLFSYFFSRPHAGQVWFYFFSYFLAGWGGWLTERRGPFVVVVVVVVTAAVMSEDYSICNSCRARASDRKHLTVVFAARDLFRQYNGILVF